MQRTRSVREAAAGLAALACAFDQALTDQGDRLALTPEEATEATADLSRLTDDLAALADLLGAGPPSRRGTRWRLRGGPPGLPRGRGRCGHRRGRGGPAGLAFASAVRLASVVAVVPCRVW